MIVLEKPRVYSYYNRKERFEDVKQYGQYHLGSIALREQVREFRHHSFEGFVPYVNVGQWAVVIGCPQTPQMHNGIAIQTFNQNFKHVIYYQVPYHVAYALNQRGMSVHHVGHEQVIQLSDVGLIKKNVDGYQVKVSGEEQKTFTFHQHHKKSSQLVFDPLYENGYCIGYELNQAHDIQTDLLEYVFYYFKEIGIKSMSLGLSSRYNIYKNPFNYSIWLDALMRMMPVKTITLFDQRRGIKLNPLFLAVNSPHDLSIISALMRVDQII